jgi:circadian clock protein KaiB
MRRLSRKKPASSDEPFLANAEPYILCLYVTGMSPRSAEAYANIRAICEKHLHGRYDLEVVDIYKQPSSARDEQIIAAPTLVKRLPVPLKRLVGDLSREDRVLMGLGLFPLMDRL